jgi:hypothetical protein
LQHKICRNAARNANEKNQHVYWHDSSRRLSSICKTESWRRPLQSLQCQWQLWHNPWHGSWQEPWQG